MGYHAPDQAAIMSLRTVVLHPADFFVRSLLVEPHIIELPDREYDIYNASDLEQALNSSLLHREVIVDFKRVRHLDSTALGVLVSFRKRRAKMNFPPMRLIQPSTQVRMILHVSQLDTIWPVFDTLEEAIASFQE